MPQYEKVDDGTLSNGHFIVTIEDGGYVSIAEEIVSEHVHGLTYWGEAPLYSGSISRMPQSIRKEILAGLGLVG